MSDEAARITRGEQAETAVRQFLGPAFDVARAEYLAKLAEIAARPLTNDMRAGMEKLALAVKVLDETRRQIESLVVDAALARKTKLDVDKMANLTTEQKRWGFM